MWPRTPDGGDKAITEFFVFLVKCHGCLSDGEYFDELNTSSMLQTVQNKLLERLQRKWASLVHRIEAVDLRRPLFADFVIFVEKEPDIANNLHIAKKP